jgi:hypothetical protein
MPRTRPRGSAAHSTATVHELPVWIRSDVERGHIDAYDAPTWGAAWLAGAYRDGHTWVTGDGHGRAGRCDDGNTARHDVLAIAQAVLHARHAATGTLTLRPIS